MVLLITLIAKGKSLSPYQPQCSKNICQNLPSHVNSPICHQDECSHDQSNEILKTRTESCLNGCQNFKTVIRDNPEDGCPKFCNLTQLESSFTWNDKLERLPVLSCIYGCEKAVKNLVTHILSEIQNIIPPQILRKNSNQKSYNETSETVTFSKKIEKEISGKLINNMRKRCLK